jgi:antitoxin component of MazEF toxin-antitoxin module
MSTDRHLPGRGIQRGAIDPNRRIATRTLSRQGNSICVPVPRPFMHAMNVVAGDMVEMIFDFEFDGFFVRPVRRNTVRREDVEHLRTVVEPPK